jgi:hypothetical protein
MCSTPAGLAKRYKRASLFCRTKMGEKELLLAYFRTIFGVASVKIKIRQNLSKSGTKNCYWIVSRGHLLKLFKAANS